MQDAAFSSEFLLGIPGGPLGDQQNRWMLPVNCHGLHYTPRLLAVMLLLAHHLRLPHNLTTTPHNEHHSHAAGEGDTSSTVQPPQVADAHTSTDATAPVFVTASGVPEHSNSDCSGATESAQNSEAQQTPQGTASEEVFGSCDWETANVSGTARAVCEGLDRVSWNPEPTQQPSAKRPSEANAKSIVIGDDRSDSAHLKAGPPSRRIGRQYQGQWIRLDLLTSSVQTRQLHKRQHHICCPL